MHFDSILTLMYLSVCALSHINILCMACMNHGSRRHGAPLLAPELDCKGHGYKSLGFTGQLSSVSFCIFLLYPYPGYRLSICLRFAYTLPTPLQHPPMRDIFAFIGLRLRGTHLPTVPRQSYAILVTPAKMPTRAVLKTYFCIN